MISSLRLAVCFLLACAACAFAQPVAPINCAATGFSTSSGTFIGLSWTDRSGDETQWAIRYYIGTSTTPAGIFAIASETRTQSNVTGSHVWLGGAANTTYRFTVQSYNGSLYSALSPISSEITTNSFTPTTIAAPCGSINVSWPNLPNESGYDVFLKGAAPSLDTRIGQVGADVTFFPVTPPLIKPATTYQFYVRPFISTKAIGNSTVLFATFNGMTSRNGVSGAPGTPFSHAFNQVTGSTVSSRTLVGTPSTLTFNATNGTLSGFYPPTGNYTLFYTVNFATGCHLTQTFTIRSRASAGAPVVGTTLPAWTTPIGATRDTPLAGTFLDPEAESAYRVNTTAGNMDFILFDTSTPNTVTNFKNYVEAGKYNDVAFHRCFPGVALQSGTIKGTGTGSNFTSVVPDTPTPNEPGISNLRGTLAMTKVSATDPDSATNEFFINVANNSTAFDSSNGGTTVFGRVASSGLSVVDAIAALQRRTYNLNINGSSTTTSYPDFPLTGAAALPNNIDQTRLVKINSITPIATLNYSITGNTNPTVASASIINHSLRLTSLMGGSTNITVTATDLDGQTTHQIIAVDVLDTFSTWAAQQTFPNGQSAPNQDPDGDGWNNLNEFAFLGNPGSPSATSQVVFPGVTGTTTTHLTLTFPVRRAAHNLSYHVEANDGLSGGWTNLWKSSDGFSHPQVVTAVNQSDRTVLTIKDTATIGPNPQRFLRTRVVQE